MGQMRGKASLAFERPPVILSSGSVAGSKEGQGPLGPFFDRVETDDRMGEDSWELAESAMQRQAARIALKKAGLFPADVRYAFAGDLLGQLIATSFGNLDLAVPLFGLYGACSTMGEAMGLGAMTVAGGFGDRVLAMASSHFATAEKQFRFPLAYGNQRPLSAAWTVTGCGAVVIGAGTEHAADKDSGQENGRGVRLPSTCGLARIAGITTGRLVDVGARDSMNMGAAMAPAAFHTIEQNLEDFGVDESWYDRIVTGDLGEVGSRILLDLMREKGRDLSGIHMDCGVEIYDKEKQDTHAGGSGCGCSAVTLCAQILPRLQDGTWRRVLFVPTGALLSTVSFNEGQTIPSIAHGVVLEHID